MSEIFVDTIRKTGGSLGTDIRIKNTSVYESDGGTSVTQNLVQGLAKSWVNFNGTGTIAARDSLNNASLTDNGTGHYTITLTNAMNNANYVATFGDSAADSNHDGGWLGIRNGTTNATDSFIVTTDGRITGEVDPLYTMASVLGDLA